MFSWDSSLLDYSPNSAHLECPEFEMLQPINIKLECILIFLNGNSSVCAKLHAHNVTEHSCRKYEWMADC